MAQKQRKVDDSSETNMYGYLRRQTVLCVLSTYKAILRATHIELSAGRSAQIMAAPTPTGSRAASDNVPPTC
jgi:hypothetical protein